MAATSRSRLQKIYERDGRNTSSNDPKMMEARVFIGNLPLESVTRQTIEEMYKEFGKILGISLHKSYGFVQFDNAENANAAVQATHGKTIEGKRIDVNIATERRKEADPSPSPRGGKDHNRDRDGGGRRRDRGRERDRSRERYRGRYRSPTPPRMYLEYEGRARPWERLGLLDSPYPRPPPPRDPYLDPYHDPFYLRPRDDPYDRFPERLPPRDLPPRDFPPPRRDPYGPRDPFDHRPPRPRSPPELRGRGPPPPPLPPLPSSVERRPVERVAEDGVLDMEIIIVNRPQREYGEVVKGRMEGVGVRVEIATLSPTVSLSDALDSAAQRGLLYCVIITSQHELHRSLTLTILHGRNPQEHKNMPLDDALGLIDRDFERYCQGVREGRIPPRKPPRDAKTDVTSLLSKAASGEDLNAGQLQSLIEILQEKKQNTATARPTATMDFSAHQIAKEDIQRQQADLQAKILSLLGSNAVVPSPPSQNSTPKVPPAGGGGMGGSSAGVSGYSSAPFSSYGLPSRGGAEGGASARGYGGYGSGGGGGGYSGGYGY